MSKYFWYVEPQDPDANRVIAQHLSEEDTSIQRECSDGRLRDLWFCDHAFITRLEKAQNSYRLLFKVFVRKGKHGQIRPWPFSKKTIPCSAR